MKHYKIEEATTNYLNCIFVYLENQEVLVKNMKILREL